MTVDLAGVFAPVVSTFSARDGELDIPAFEANVAAHLQAGLHGIVVAGSTGEAALLDASERGALVDAARRRVPSGKPLIVGTGAESTRTCLQLTKDAASRGADAVIVVAPHYYSTAMTPVVLRSHYLRIADASPVPVMLYTIPKYMHFALDAALVAELALHENVIGIKDSSGNRELFVGYLESQSPRFAVLTGSAPMFHHAMASGARGGILAAALFAPSPSLDVFDAVRSEDDAAATAAQTRLTPVGAKIVGDLGVAGVKAAMDLVGLSGGPVRSPLVPLDAAQRGLVQQLLESAELAAA
jgi:4-hydroxy-2-oxoglutarate aldolase